MVLLSISFKKGLQDMLTWDVLCFLNHAQLCTRERSISAFAGLFSTCVGVMSHTADISKWYGRQELCYFRLRETEEVSCILAHHITHVQRLNRHLLLNLSETFHSNDTGKERFLLSLEHV